MIQLKTRLGVSASCEALGSNGYARSVPHLCRSHVVGLLPAVLFQGIAAAQGNDPGDQRLEEVLVVGATIGAASLGDQSAVGSRLGVSTFDLPASASSIPGARIELQGQSNMNEVAAGALGFTSGFSSSGAGYSYVVRGFSDFNSYSILLDGAKSLVNSGALTYPYDTWNVERIETLSGAASVLYGDGAIGGAVNVVPRKPSAERSATIRAAYGTFDTARLGMDSTGPITEDLLYRFTLSRTETDGHVDRGGSSNVAASASLSYEVSDDLNLIAFLDYGDRSQPAYNGLPLVDGRVTKSRRRLNYAPADADVSFEDLRFRLVADWRLGPNAALKNTTYYADGDRLWRDAYEFAYRPDIDMIERSFFGTWLQHQEEVANLTELTWEHTLLGRPSTTSAGFQVTDLENWRFVDTYAFSDLLDVYRPIPGTFPVTADVSRNHQVVRLNQYALFAENRLEITPALALVTGLRGDRTDIDRTDLDDGSEADAVHDPISWRAGMVYSVSSALNFYAQYSTATDPVASVSSISASNLAFDPSEGRQAEIGFKGATQNGRVEWTVALYEIVKKDLLTPDPENPMTTIQVGQQSSRGFEGSVQYRATENLRLELNATTLEARYDDYYQLVGGEFVSRIGNRPTGVPEQNAYLALLWAPNAAWLLWGAIEYKGDAYDDPANTLRIPSYAVTDIGLRWTATDAVTVDLRLDNVFDRFYAETAAYSSMVIGKSRAFEAAVTMQF
jgi:iron complex outermembrane receptor protein